MIINITGKQMEITPTIRQHAEKRLAKLEKWQTQLINQHIILSKQPQGFVAGAPRNVLRPRILWRYNCLSRRIYPHSAT